MILTAETQEAQRNTSPSACLSSTYPTWTGLELNPDLYGKMLLTKFLAVTWPF